MKVLPHTRSCFVCGETNPVGLKLRFETDGQLVRAHFIPRGEHIGFKQVVHGGLIATVLDEIMVWACAVRTKRFAFCAELNVRFISPLRPNEAADVTAELVTNRRNKMFDARAEVRGSAGKIVASATGKYLPIKEAELREMATDFVDDPGWIFGE